MTMDYFFVFFSGVSGSGKTSMSMVLLRRLFEVAGGGHETDSFKHLSAAVTVLRSLSSAATLLSPESSRMVCLFVLVVFKKYINMFIDILKQDTLDINIFLNIL